MFSVEYTKLIIFNEIYHNKTIEIFHRPSNALKINSIKLEFSSGCGNIIITKVIGLKIITLKNDVISIDHYFYPCLLVIYGSSYSFGHSNFSHFNPS